jgi:hypothetical protein
MPIRVLGIQVAHTVVAVQLTRALLAPLGAQLMAILTGACLALLGREPEDGICCE